MNYALSRAITPGSALPAVIKQLSDAARCCASGCRWRRWPHRGRVEGESDGEGRAGGGACRRPRPGASARVSCSSRRHRRAQGAPTGVLGQGPACRHPGLGSVPSPARPSFLARFGFLRKRACSFPEKQRRESVPSLGPMLQQRPRREPRHGAVPRRPGWGASGLTSRLNFRSHLALMFRRGSWSGDPQSPAARSRLIGPGPSWRAGMACPLLGALSGADRPPMGPATSKPGTLGWKPESPRVLTCEQVSSSALLTTPTGARPPARSPAGSAAATARRAPRQAGACPWEPARCLDRARPSAQAAVLGWSRSPSGPLRG